MSAPNQQSETAQMQSKGSGRTGLYAAIAVVVILVVVLAGLYAAGYIHGPSSSKTPPAVGACTALTILGAGSTFVQQLQQEWASVYTTDSVSYDGVGSGAGISEITAKTIAYGASDAPLNATQAAAAPGLLTMPESAGAVSIIFNLPSVTFKVGQSLNLTGNVLAEIYLGTITTWNAPAIATLNPGIALPSNTIAPYHRSDGSGTSYAFTQFLSVSNSTWKSEIGYNTLPDWAKTVGSGAKGSSGIAGAIKETPYSIGYVDLGEAINAGPLEYAAVQNPSGDNIIPSVNNTASAMNDVLKTTTLPAGSGNWSGVSMINAPGAKDYPIATLTYMLFYQSAGVNPAISSAADASAFVHWLNWTITTGQSYSAQLYYIPLPTGVVQADQATLASMTYNGAAIASCS
jgi:phosphate transport system substrate-binding protein